MKYFSVFSGLGGFELGIAKHNPKWECIGYSEIDTYAETIYKKHFKGVKNYGDITKIRTDEIPDFDLFVGGFPCQAFSVAGLGHGELDTRGTLYHDILRILTDKRPRYFILENVKGLLTRKHRQTFITIIKGLSNLGYTVEWSLLNSKDYGLPQNRERVFITGYIGTGSSGKVFPLRQNNSQDTNRDQGGVEDSRELGQDVAWCLDANYWKGANTLVKSRRQLVLVPKIVQINDPTHSNDRVYSPDGISPTLNTAQGGRRQPLILDHYRVRRLTPLECERVQGLPDNYTEGVSDTRRYKAIGNSVSPPVISRILQTWDDWKLNPDMEELNESN